MSTKKGPSAADLLKLSSNGASTANGHPTKCLVYWHLEKRASIEPLTSVDGDATVGEITNVKWHRKKYPAVVVMKSSDVPALEQRLQSLLEELNSAETNANKKRKHSEKDKGKTSRSKTETTSNNLSAKVEAQKQLFQSYLAAQSIPSSVPTNTLSAAPTSTLTSIVPNSTLSSTESTNISSVIPANTLKFTVPNSTLSLAESANTLSVIPASTSTPTVPASTLSSTESTNTSSIMPASKFSTAKSTSTSSVIPAKTFTSTDPTSTVSSTESAYTSSVLLANTLKSTVNTRTLSSVESTNTLSVTPDITCGFSELQPTTTPPSYHPYASQESNCLQEQAVIRQPTNSSSSYQTSACYVPPSLGSANYVPPTYSYLEELRNANIIMHGESVEQVCKKCESMNDEIDELKAKVLLLEEETKSLKMMKGYHILTASEIDFMRKVLNKLSSEVASPVSSDTLSTSSAASSPSLSLSWSSRDKNEGDVSEVQETGNAHEKMSIAPCPEVDYVGTDEDDKVELVKGTGVWVTVAQKTNIILKGKKGLSFMFRIILDTLFSTEELINGCAVGARHNPNSDRAQNLPLDSRRLNAAKAFILCHAKKAGLAQLSDPTLNAIANSKCTGARRHLKRAMANKQSQNMD